MSLSEDEISRLVRKHRGLMRTRVNQVMRRPPPGWSAEDVAQQSWLFVVRQLRRYEPGRGERGFDADGWCKQCIKWGIGYTLQNAWEVPQGTLAKMRRIERAWAMLPETLRRAPSRAEVAAHAGVTEDEVELWETRAPTLHRPSLEQVDEDGLTLADRAASEEPSAEAMLDREQLRRALGREIAALPSRERYLVQARMEGVGLRELGHDLGLSKERARQIAAAGHKRLAERLLPLAEPRPGGPRLAPLLSLPAEPPIGESPQVERQVGPPLDSPPEVLQAYFRVHPGSVLALVLQAVCAGCETVKALVVATGKPRTTLGPTLGRLRVRYPPLVELHQPLPGTTAERWTPTEAGRALARGFEEDAA